MAKTRVHHTRERTYVHGVNDEDCTIENSLTRSLAWHSQPSVVYVYDRRPTSGSHRLLAFSTREQMFRMHIDVSYVAPSTKLQTIVMVKIFVIQKGIT